MKLKINRRSTVALLLGATLATAGWAQSFPNKALRIVVPFGPGGVADITARIVAQKMSQNMGQPVVIENKPGAGGVGAADLVAKSTPDGYTMLLMSNASAVTATMFTKLPFDMSKDFALISTMGYFDIGVVTTTESKFKTMGELLAYAKANPGKLNVGSINTGSTQNLAAELFKANAGVDMQIVPFNGTPAVVNALRGGQIDVAVEILSPIMGQIKGGALRALAITDDQRSASLPDVPTTKEVGLPNYLASSWNALAVPAGTPKDVVARLNREIVAAVKDPEVSKKLRDLDIEPRTSTPEQTQGILQRDIKRWGDVIIKANIPRQ